MFCIDPYVYVLGLKGSSFFLCCLHYYVYMSSQSTHINSSNIPQVLL
ncbi:hypothetical protein MtrunA17_Chr3g0128521 [Medicago truncatula]|uniref:Transmembrane protein n=1 Tax=Medicago truncatula TaxID=3880 RepID=A0A396IZ96_MEDTR|nr:hypothetical protein MtrunA17_Chr3g0128521 [Medicago truncatula]